MTPSCPSSIVSLDMNDLKYWPSNAGVIAFSTLQAQVSATNTRCVRVRTYGPYRIPVLRSWSSERRQTSLEVHPPCSLSRRPLCQRGPASKIRTRPGMSSEKARNTYQREFLSDSFYGPGDVLVQGRMTRLKHRRIEPLPPNEQIGRIHASNIQDRVYRDLNWVTFRFTWSIVRGKLHQLNSVTPLRVSETTFSKCLPRR